MGENLPVIISFACHHGGPDLAQPYAMSPTGAGQDETSGDIELYIFFVHDKSRAVQMCFGQGPAYLQFFADGKGPMCPDNLQHFNTAGSSSVDGNQIQNLTEINTAFTMDQVRLILPACRILSSDKNLSSPDRSCSTLGRGSFCRLYCKKR